MLNQEVNYAIFLRRQHRSQVERINALLFDTRAALKMGAWPTPRSLVRGELGTYALTDNRAGGPGTRQPKSA